MASKTALRNEDTATLHGIVAGTTPRSASHIMRIIADREIERRKAA